MKKNKEDMEPKVEKNDSTGHVKEQNTPKEIGGGDRLDPTRYGDWEQSGRCIDF